MKINFSAFLLLLILFVLGCNEKPMNKDSYLHTLVDSLPVDKSNNIFIYSINPNDCINCLYGFSQINKQLAEINNAKIYILAVDRAIEKKELINTSQGIDLNDSINKIVLWSKNVFHEVGTASKKKNLAGISLLTIYNYTTDSIIYSMPVKEIVNAEELIKYTTNN